MGELAREVGLPASAIRFYLNEGFLPPPERPTKNSALYDDRHVAALKALKRIKARAPGLPLPQVKRILELIDQGVEESVAVSLQRAVAHAGGALAAKRLTLAALAKESGADEKFVRRLIRLGIIAPPDDSGTAFDASDAEVAKMAARLHAMAPKGLDAVARIAALLREASELEMRLRDELSKGRSAQEAAEISGEMQGWANVWHAYLFARLRLREIAAYGLGETSRKAAPKASAEKHRVRKSRGK